MTVTKIGILPENNDSPDTVIEFLRKTITKEHPGHVLLPLHKFRNVEIAELILLLKEECIPISLECILPYETVANDWSEDSRDRFFFVMEHCDKETMLQTQFSLNALKKTESYIRKYADMII